LKSYDHWTTGLLGRFDKDDMQVQNDKTITFKLADDYDDPEDIQGWTVSYKAAPGQKFKYSAGEGGFQEAVAGKVGSVEVRDDNGALVMKITEIKNVDIGDIYPYIVNINEDNGPRPDQKTVMEYIVRGNDKFIGSNGNDGFGIHDDYGDDFYQGRGGGNYYEMGAGNDTVAGGNDFDHLSYKNTMWSQGARQGIVVDLETGGKGTVIDAWGDTDVFTNVEMVSGSRFADTFNGGLSSPTWWFNTMGGRGADTFNFEKSDHLYVSYNDDHWDGGKRGIIANLGPDNGSGDVKGTIRDGFGFTDKTVNVRKVEGTQHDDTFNGSRLNDHFNGNGGEDQYNGKKGVDWIQFDNNNNNGGGAINVDLSLNGGEVIDDGYGNTETATKIEGVTGSRESDVIKGDSGNNEFAGFDGEDTLTGGGGNDKFIYGTYTGGGFGDHITDFNNGDKLLFDTDRIDGLDDVIRFRVGTSANSKAGDSQFFFNDEQDTLYLDTNGKADGGVEMVAVFTNGYTVKASDLQLVNLYLEIV
jgi:hypothetical protein